MSSQRSRNPINSEIKRLVSYLKTSVNVSASQCSRKDSRKKSSYIIHVINRTQRKILNLNDVVTQLKNAGFTSTQSLTFEEYTVAEQMQMMTCADLLIGVQGAALQW